MASKFARFAHASATPPSIDLILDDIDIDEIVPEHTDRTAYGKVLRYILGVRYRTADLDLMAISQTDRDNFLAFYRSAMRANTAFTFTPDYVNHPGETWTALFMSGLKFKPKKLPNARVAGTFTVTIQDAPVNL